MVYEIWGSVFQELGILELNLKEELEGIRSPAVQGSFELIQMQILVSI